MLSRFRHHRLRSSSTAPTSPAPVFILGSPRSGTSMLHWALLQHEALWGSEESEFLLPLARALRPAYDRGMQFTPHSWLAQQNVSQEEFAASVGLGLSALYASRSGGKRWVEQTPSYSTVALELAGMFPAAQFLHIVRDGRQVADSMRRMWDWSMAEAAGHWHDHVSAVLKLEQQHPARVLRIRYEEMIADPQQQLPPVFAFLRLSMEPAAAGFIAGRPINTAPGTSSSSSMEKLQPRWHSWSQAELQTFLDIAGPLLQELGYA